MAQARSDATRGHFVAPMGSRTCVEAIVEEWWQTREGHRASTRARDRMVLDHDVLPELGRARLVEVTHEEVQAWVNLLAKRLTPSSVQRSFSVLRQVLDVAVDSGLLAANPASRVRLPRPQRFEAHFLTPDELELLASAIELRYRAMVLVMAWGTLRIGEAAGLRRIDLDLAAGRLRVANNVVEVGSRLHEGPPKTAAGRRSMTLPTSVAAELRVHVARSASSRYVFPAPKGGPLRAADWRKGVWHPAVEAARLAPLRPHDLKHTGVALLAAAGVDPSEIARRAGHTSVALTNGSQNVIT
jgi:integrase